MNEILESVKDVIIKKNKEDYYTQSKHIENIVEEVEGLYDLLKDLKCFVAGGTVTSVFTNKEVNDLDIYFRSIDDLKVFLLASFGEFEGSELQIEHGERYEDIVDLDSHQLICVGYTNKSIMFKTKHSGQDIQLIHTGFYEKPEDIFETFDYTINMGAYDFKEGVFVLGSNFFLDNSLRKLRVNTNTSFPIISQLRIDKYKQRGYTINRKEFIKLSLAVSQLNINSWEEAKEAIGGMYGFHLDEIFDETKNFTFEELYNQLEDLEANLEKAKPFEEVSDVYLLIEEIEDMHSVSPSEEEHLYYKKVRSTDNESVFLSEYDKNFKYVVGEKVKCEGKGIYVYKNKGSAKRHWQGDTVIKLSSGDTRAKLHPDLAAGNGKYRTNDELTVVEVVKEED